MGDGPSDGHRENLEERARQWKLASFGVDLCYSCGKKGLLHSTDPYSFEKYKHMDHLIGDVPVRVRFCSQKCVDANVTMLNMVKALEGFIGGEARNIYSVALQVSARELIEEVLRKSRRPNV